MNKIWEMLKSYFAPTGTSDNFGNPFDMSGFALFALWVIRKETGWPFVVHNAVEYAGHSKDSQHYRRNALDGHFVTDVPYLEQVNRIEKILKDWQLFDFVGMGIYPYWNNPGFHFDARGSKARWGYDKDGKMQGYDFIKEGIK